MKAHLTPNDLAKLSPSDARAVVPSPGLQHKDWEPTRRAFSRAEAEEAALAWYRAEFGPGKEATNKEAYYAGMGMLVHFIRDTFPPA